MSILSLTRHNRGLGLSPRRRRAKGAAGPSIVQDGLVAEWRFDEGAGQVLTDYSGNGNHGRLGSTTGADAGDPTWTAQGLSFDGGDFVDCGTLGISGGDGRTVVVIIKGGTGGDLSFGWEGDGTINPTRWTFRGVPFVNIRFETNGGVQEATDFTIFDTWKFMALTQSGTNLNTVTAYLDGDAYTFTMDQELDTSGSFAWARRNILEYSACEIAYGLAYDRALSSAEIAHNRGVLTAIVAGRGVTLP